MQILDLPLEIQLEILRHLPWRDHFQAAHVSSSWESLLQLRNLSCKRYYDTHARDPNSQAKSTTNHRLLMQVLALEVLPNGEAGDIFMKQQQQQQHDRTGAHLFHSSFTEKRLKALMDVGHKDPRRTLWTSGALVRIGNSSLFSSDKLMLHTEDCEARDSAKSKSDGGWICFEITFWKQQPGIFQPVPFLVQEEEKSRNYIAQYDWHLGTYQDLFDFIRADLERDIMTPDLLGCWCFFGREFGQWSRDGECWLGITVTVITDGTLKQVR